MLLSQDGIQQAKLALRQTPIGTDRNHSRYWVFSSVTPGLFIEKGWVDPIITHKIQKEDKDKSRGRDEAGGENGDSTEKTWDSLIFYLCCTYVVDLQCLSNLSGLGLVL